MTLMTIFHKASITNRPKGPKTAQGQNRAGLFHSTSICSSLYYICSAGAERESFSRTGTAIRTFSSAGHSLAIDFKVGQKPANF